MNQMVKLAKTLFLQLKTSEIKQKEKKIKKKK